MPREMKGRARDPNSIIDLNFNLIFYFMKEHVGPRVPQSHRIKHQISQLSSYSIKDVYEKLSTGELSGLLITCINSYRRTN